MSEGERADDELDRLQTLDVQRGLAAETYARLGESARLVFELCMEQDLTWPQQADHLKRSLQVIEAAHKEMKYHGRKVRAEWVAAERRRMRALQESRKESS